MPLKQEICYIYAYIHICRSLVSVAYERYIYAADLLFQWNLSSYYCIL
jgi:hypothetical protein